MSQRLVDISADLEVRIDTALVERKAELDRRRRELEALTHQQEEQRRRTASEANSRIDLARELRRVGETLRQGLAPVNGGGGGRGDR